jgi:hypothetical protein
LRRTLARTGRVLRLETARLTTDRPRARFSCMTESLTSMALQSMSVARDGVRRRGPKVQALLVAGRKARPGSDPSVVGIFPLSSHSVITVVRLWSAWTAALIRAEPRGGRRRPCRGQATVDAGGDRRATVDIVGPDARGGAARRSRSTVVGPVVHRGTGSVHGPIRRDRDAEALGASTAGPYSA